MASQKQLEFRHILDTQGLLAALEQLKKDIAGVSEFDSTPPIHLETDKAVEELLSKAAQHAIFRIVAEALNNACKHAQADNIYLRLYQRGSNVIAEIEDDGLGFDISIVEETIYPDSDLQAALLNGKAIIESTPGKGTKITLITPIDVQ